MVAGQAGLTRAVLEETEAVGAEEQNWGRFDNSSHHREPSEGGAQDMLSEYDSQPGPTLTQGGDTHQSS